MKAWQRKRIFGTARQVGWDIEMLRDVVEGIRPDRHISKLSDRQADMLIAVLDEAARGLRNGKLGIQQEKKIYKLGYLLRWDCTAIRKFNKRTNGKWDIMDCTPAEASKLILAMEAVIEYEKNKKATETQRTQRV